MSGCVVERRVAWTPVVLSSLAVALVACNASDVRSLHLSPLQGAATASSANCETPNDCPNNRPHCESGLCVECKTDPDCEDANPACHRGTCVRCADDDHCAESQACNRARHSCALSCAADADCAGQRESRCNGSLCVECTDLSHCDDKHPFCDKPSGTCAECLTSADCPSGVCDPTERKCLECIVDGDCASGRCQQPERRCVECVTTADCTAGTCDEKGECRAPCAADVDCPKASPHCLLAQGLCVGCREHADCDPMRPVCGQGNKCAECATDSDCTRPGFPACVKARGTCGQCTVDTQCGDAGACDLERAECTGSPP